MKLDLVVTLALALLGASACKQPRSTPDDQQEVGQAGAAAVAVCGHVVFASGEAEHHEHGHERVMMMPAGGGAPRELAAGELSHFPAAVAPDGRSLLVLRSRALPNGKTDDRFVVLEFSTDGEPIGTPRELGPEGAALRNPAWSPDGSFIVFESDAESFRDLYRVEVGSGAVLRLTNDDEGNFEPAISPDGQQIAFVSSRDGNAELYLMSADGGDPRRLTNSRGDDTGPVWTPDGKRLVFASARERARGHDAYVLTLAADHVDPVVRDGSRSESVFVRDLAVSPTGDRLAFTEQVAARGAAAIVIAQLDSGRVIARTNDLKQRRVDEQPSWSADGAHLVFARSEAGRSDIVRVDHAGERLEALTNGGGVNWLPRWFAGPSCVRANKQIETPASAGG